MKIWMDGEIIDEAEANVPVTTHALHYGSGVFEGIRAYHTDQGPGIFRLQDHLDRLHASAEVYRMQIPFSAQQMREAIWQLIDQNALDSCYIRPLVFRGAGKLGVDPLGSPVKSAIMTMQWGAYLGDEAVLYGIRACMSSYRRFSSDMMPASAKATGQYLNSILAKLESTDRGFEEAILLNEQGFVSEGTGENIFIVRDGVVYTPRIEDSILPGITRKSVIEMLNYLDVKVIEAAITPEHLMAADEVFLTGTAAEVTPVRMIENHQVGGGCLECQGTGDYRYSGNLCTPCNGTGDACTGPITRAVQDLFFDTVHGKDTPFAHLLEYR